MSIHAANVVSAARAPDVRERKNSDRAGGLAALQRAAGNRAMASVLSVQTFRESAGLLATDAVARARRFYAAHSDRYSAEIVGRIQAAVGVAATGAVDQTTIEAVARWQRDHVGSPALKVDGMAGPRVLPRMFPAGLNEAGRGEAFGGQAQTEVIRRWHNLTPAGRLIELVRLVNERLAAVGVPVVTPKSEKPRGEGSFILFTWEMGIASTLLREEQPDRKIATTLVETVYHEARHAEQFFQMAQMRCGRGLSASAVAEEMQIPLRIAKLAAQSPLTRGTMPAVIAQGWFESVFGSGRDHRNAVLSEGDAAFRAREAAAAKVKANDTPANRAAHEAAKARFERAKAGHHDLAEEDDAINTEKAAGSGVTLGAPDRVVVEPPP